MNKEFLFKLIETISVSSFEKNIQNVIKEYMNNNCDQCYFDNVGNLINCINQDEQEKIMFIAHSDEIGLMISRIRNDGRMQLEEVGSITNEVYVGQKVIVLTKKGPIYGSIAKTREMFTEGKTLKDSDLILDIGVSTYEEAINKVSIGDILVHDSTYRMIDDNHIIARALDDKIGLLIINEALIELNKTNKQNKLKVGVYSVNSVMEETTKLGATTIPRLIDPKWAIAIDVGSDTTILNDMGNSCHKEMGKGPILTVGTTMDKELSQIIIDVAQKNNIPLQFDTVVYRSYTDADSIYQSGMGIKTALISIPLRYMHSPGEMVDLNDALWTIKLLVEVTKYLSI